MGRQNGKNPGGLGGQAAVDVRLGPMGIMKAIGRGTELPERRRGGRGLAQVHAMGWTGTEDTEDRDFNPTRGAREQQQGAGPGASQAFDSRAEGSPV